jgi:peptidoglycan L-alanyl-D-glutamate endopeptidase CwlK
MAYSLGARSRAELAGVHPDLVRVVERAIVITAQDFAVHDGLRTVEEQRELVARRASRTMNSKHLRQAVTGFGHAVDLVPFVNGKLRWEWGPIYSIAAAVLKASLDEGVRLRWGGVWDKPLAALVPAAAPFADYRGALKVAVERYCIRHPGPDFIDGPHFEIAAP